MSTYPGYGKFQITVRVSLKRTACQMYTNVISLHMVYHALLVLFWILKMDYFDENWVTLNFKMLIFKHNWLHLTVFFNSTFLQNSVVKVINIKIIYSILVKIYSKMHRKNYYESLFEWNEPRCMTSIKIKFYFYVL